MQSFLKKIDVQLGNDDYPFFTLLKNNNSVYDFDVKNLLVNLNNIQGHNRDFTKLDSRNIFLRSYIDTEDIVNTINKIYNYYNGDYLISMDDDKNKGKENIIYQRL